MIYKMKFNIKRIQNNKANLSKIEREINQFKSKKKSRLA